MKCSHVQRQLLTLETPGRPPAEVTLHLAACPVCQEWQRHLLQIEANLPRLPVPHSTGKARFLQKLGKKATLEKVPEPAILPLPSRSRRWPWAAGVAVAAGLLVACGLLLGNLLSDALLDSDNHPQRAQKKSEKKDKQ